MTREQYERLLQLRLIFPPIRGFRLDWKDMGELYDEFVGLLARWTLQPATVAEDGTVTVE